MKKVAIDYMKRMDIYEPYIERFERKDMPCFYENFGGFWVDQEPELYADDEKLSSLFCDCSLFKSEICSSKLSAEANILLVTKKVAHRTNKTNKTNTAKIIHFFNLC